LWIEGYAECFDQDHVRFKWRHWGVVLDGQAAIAVLSNGSMGGRKKYVLHGVMLFDNDKIR